MTPLPVRIQLSRAKGWKMPAHTVKVDRSTSWGNPFRAPPGRQSHPNQEKVMTRSIKMFADTYETVIKTYETVTKSQKNLRNCDYVCFFPFKIKRVCP